MRALFLAGALLLAGCATAPPAVQPARASLGNFAMEARFALRSERPNEAMQSASGRLTWQHSGRGDRILVANPLGQGLAEIDIRPDGAELRAADGKTYRAPDAGTLLRLVTGYELPLVELPAWLLGRPGVAGRLETDAGGRPRRLTDAGWRIDYEYDDDNAEAPPARLTLHRENDMELRLRVEDWRSLPDD